MCIFPFIFLLLLDEPRRRVACVLSAARPDYTGCVRKNPLLAIHMAKAEGSSIVDEPGEG